MRVSVVVGCALLLVACRIERIEPPPGRSTSVSAVTEPGPEDSAIVAALDQYYDRFSRRAWRAFRSSFWPGGVIATRWHPPGRSAPQVDVQTLETFLRRTREGPDRLAVFAERMVHHEITQYGELAIVWATFEATFGRAGAAPETHYGVDAFQLLKHQGEWRIVSLAFTQELPGDSLPRDPLGS